MSETLKKSEIPELVAAARVAGANPSEYWDAVDAELQRLEASDKSTEVTVEPRLTIRRD